MNILGQMMINNQFHAQNGSKNLRREYLANDT